MLNILVKNKSIKLLSWGSLLGVMMLCSGEVNAQGTSIDNFDSRGGIFSNGLSLGNSVDGDFIIGGQREFFIEERIDPDPNVSIASDNLGLDQLNFGSIGSLDKRGTALIRWDGKQNLDQNEEVSNNFQLGNIDVTDNGENDAFIWELVGLDNPDGEIIDDSISLSTILTMRVYNGDQEDNSVAELMITIDEDLNDGDLLIFFFDDFINVDNPDDKIDFTALSAIEFEIDAPGDADIKFKLLESKPVPEPSSIMSLITLSLTSLLAKKKFIKLIK